MAARRCVHHGATRPRYRNVHTSTFSVRCSVALLATHNRCVSFWHIADILSGVTLPLLTHFRKLFTRIANRAFPQGEGPSCIAGSSVLRTRLDRGELLIARHFVGGKGGPDANGAAMSANDPKRISRTGVPAIQRRRETWLHACRTGRCKTIT